MITKLHIENYALIEQLHLKLDEGFSVITGETGAGKSILLGALGLLLGKRADTKSIKDGAQKCVIEAEFQVTNPNLKVFFEQAELDFDGKNIIVRRELTASGKTRAFINDTPAPLSLLTELGSYLIDIHSQHQNLLINRQDYQLSILDLLAENTLQLERYKDTYKAWKNANKQYKEKQKEIANQQSEEDYLRYQYEMLSEAQLKAEEQEELEQELQTLEHAEEIKHTLYQVCSILNEDECGIIQQLRIAQRQLNNISKVYPQITEMAQRTESCYIELKDLGESIENRLSDIEIEPGRLQYVSNRLSQIYDLEQKHHVENVEQLIDIQRKIAEKLNVIEQQDEILDTLRAQIESLYNTLEQQAAELSKQREKAAKALEKQIITRLQTLGMPNVRFQAEITQDQEYDYSGKDKVQFLFSANSGTALQNISQIASGGEIARVMLTLKTILSQKANMPTIIFDEIDTGVSGSMAERMAQMMKDMAQGKEKQVISITHLPQIAAMGTHHFLVYKQEEQGTTLSHITPLNQQQRIEEIAHMLSGNIITQAAINNAQELLANQI